MPATRFTLSPALLAAALAPAALAQPGSDVTAANKHAWGQNVGWLNFRDAGTPAASSGVRLGSPHSPTFLSGWIWGENIGWIHVGDGAPADGIAYANATGAEFGVNVGPTGDLSGYAWGENIGWVNFSGGGLATPPKPARFDAASLRFRGYAWAPNIGWLNLDHAVDYVALFCPSDFNRDEFVDPLDYNAFLNAFEAGDMAADFNRDGFLDPLDYNAFINDFEGGC